MTTASRMVIRIGIFVGAAALTDRIAPGLPYWPRTLIGLIWIVACGLQSFVTDFFRAAFPETGATRR